MDIAVQTCPECGASIPTEPGPTWCEHCNWNIRAPAMAQPAGLFDRLSARISTRAAERLFEQVLADPPTQHRITSNEVLATAFAVVVHALAFATLGAGVGLIVWAWPGPGIAFGLIVVLAALSLRPRLGRLPKHALAPHEVPALADLTDRVADAVGAPRVDAYVFDARLNARFARVGLRRRSVLWIGMPLWCGATSEERVALLAHELGHSVNGDPGRSLVVGSAMNALNRWYAMLLPQTSIVRNAGGVERGPRRIGSGPVGQLAAAERLVRPLLWALSSIPWSAAFVLNQLRWSASQRAEYLADAVSARVAGSAAVSSVFDLFYLGDIYAFIVDRSRTYERDRNPLDVFAARVRDRTPREIERLRRIERLPGAAVDGTHPANWRRLAVIEKLAIATPAVVIDAAANDRIDVELTPYRQGIGLALQGLGDTPSRRSRFR